MPPLTFAHVLGELARQEATGLLEIGTTERAAVFMSKGRPVFVERAVLGETLGRMLVRLGRISPQQYSEVIHVMTEKLVANEEIRFGEVLIQLGMMDGGAVSEVLALQVEEKLLGCFSLQDVTHEFHEGREHLDGIQPFNTRSTKTLILVGCKRHFGPERFGEQLLPLVDRYPKLVADPGQIVREYSLDVAETKILRGLGTGQTLGSIWDECDLGRDHCGQLFVALLAGGDLQLVSSSTQQTTQQGRKRIITRPKGGSKPARTTHRLARLRLKRLSESQARLQAETAFQRGQQALRENILVRAKTEFQRALDLYGDPVEYRLYRAWVEYLLTPPDGNIEDVRKNVMALAKQARQGDKSLAFAFYIEGYILERGGDGKAAVKSLRQASELNPNDTVIERELRLAIKRHGS